MRYLKKYWGNRPDKREVYLFHANRFELELIAGCVKRARQYLPPSSLTSRALSQLKSIVSGVGDALDDKSEPEKMLKDAKYD